MVTRLKRYFNLKVTARQVHGVVCVVRCGIRFISAGGCVTHFNSPAPMRVARKEKGIPSSHLQATRNVTRSSAMVVASTSWGNGFTYLRSILIGAIKLVGKATTFLTSVMAVHRAPTPPITALAPNAYPLQSLQYGRLQPWSDNDSQNSDEQDRWSTPIIDTLAPCAYTLRPRHFGLGHLCHYCCTLDITDGQLCDCMPCQRPQCSNQTIGCPRHLRLLVDPRTWTAVVDHCDGALHSESDDDEPHSESDDDETTTITYHATSRLRYP
jgi:hypothetical protein